MTIKVPFRLDTTVYDIALEAAVRMTLGGILNRDEDVLMDLDAIVHNIAVGVFGRPEYKGLDSASKNGGISLEELENAYREWMKANCPPRDEHEESAGMPFKKEIE